MARRQSRRALRDLLVATLGTDLDPAGDEVARALSAMTATDMARLPQVADTQGLSLQLVAGLEPHKHVVPEAVWDELRQRTLAHRAAQLRALVELEKIADVLDAVCGSWLVFKGPVLADVVYRVPGRRSYSDIDILIPPNTVRETMRALTSHGLILGTQNWRLMSERDTRELNFYSERGAAFDVHWFPLGAMREWPGITFDVPRCLERARRVTLGGQAQVSLEVSTFSPADQLVQLAAHAVLSGMGPLRYALDIEQALLHQRPDSNDLAMVLRETHAELLLRVGLDRASRALPHLRSMLDGHITGGGSWAALLRGWNRVKPPQASHEFAPFDFLLSSTRQSVPESFKALAAATRPRVAALARPRDALARLRSGAQDGFSLDPFLTPIDDGYRDRVLSALDEPNT